jgi:biotin carboxyl carrier protein
MARWHLTHDADTWTADVKGHEVVLRQHGHDVARLEVHGREDVLHVAGLSQPFTAAAATSGDVVWVSIDGQALAFTATDAAPRARSAARDSEAFTPPMSATVVRINVAPGDPVRDGDVLIALEAMKMELPIRAPRDGVVRSVHCAVGDLVQPGDVLIEMAE